jgi:hypothetical protein
VESVTFVLSSGVATIDEAIRRIIESQKPYLSTSTSRSGFTEWTVVMINDSSGAGRSMDSCFPLFLVPRLERG